jgi:hypothetical protein
MIRCVPRPIGTIAPPDHAYHRKRSEVATATRARRLSDKDLAKLLALTKRGDSVELKLTVAISERSRSAAALGVDPLDAQIRQVFFSTRRT